LEGCVILSTEHVHGMIDYKISWVSLERPAIQTFELPSNHTSSRGESRADDRGGW
jgi:hypothetical protein